MKASELLIRCLENEGVRYVFGVPGEENLDVMDALLDSSISFVVTRHEQGAAFMADVQGRLTGKAGVCLSTLGPGATNLLTGVADAYLDRAPAGGADGTGLTRSDAQRVASIHRRPVDVSVRHEMECRDLQTAHHSRKPCERHLK